MAKKERPKRSLSPIDAILALEQGCESLEDAYSNMQVVINDGEGWLMQGSMGRAMMEAIEIGRCCLGRAATHDYYGNRIPSRDEVQDGTKGSLGFVRERCGEEWAKMIEEIL
jgi:hypothetical protein